LDLARTCPGRPDGSPTEQVAHALSRLIGDSDYYLDLHSGGTRLQVYPLAGYMMHPDPGVLDGQRRMAHAFGLPIIWGTDSGPNGRSLSVARDARVPAIYAEYLGGGVCDPQGVAAYVRGCLNVLADLHMIAGVVARPDLEPLVVEDTRPGSGILQIQHPSPIHGFFRPAARLGRRVRPGDELGQVADPLGPSAVPVRSDRFGFVLALRAFARVSAGETVAVVMETDGTPPPWPSRPLPNTHEGADGAS
jgi:predicted deacylase